MGELKITQSLRDAVNRLDDADDAMSDLKSPADDAPAEEWIAYGKELAKLREARNEAALVLANMVSLAVWLNDKRAA